MLRFLQILDIVLVSVALTPALAHALELPGKMRLDREKYLAVQPIYYPGFTVAGFVGEAGGMVGLLVLVFVTPGAGAFIWTLVALLLLVAMHVTYWVMTHPVNNFWLKNVKLSGSGAKFFSTFASKTEGDWAKLRDLWEYSHVARAALAAFSLIALAVAVTE